MLVEIYNLQQPIKHTKVINIEPFYDNKTHLHYNKINFHTRLGRVPRGKKVEIKDGRIFRLMFT